MIDEHDRERIASVPREQLEQELGWAVLIIRWQVVVICLLFAAVAGLLSR